MCVSFSVGDVFTSELDLAFSHYLHFLLLSFLSLPVECCAFGALFTSLQVLLGKEVCIAG